MAAQVSAGSHPSPVSSLCLFQRPCGLQEEEALGDISAVQSATAPESAGQCSVALLLDLTGSVP